MNCKTSHEMWKRLLGQYLQKAATNKHVLQHEFFAYKYIEDHKIMDHITTIETLTAQLQDVGAPKELQVMTKILISLPDEFGYFQSIWDNVPEEDKTLSNLTARLLKEESAYSRRKVKSSEKTDRGNERQDAALLTSRQQPQPSSSSHRQPSSFRQDSRSIASHSHPNDTEKPYCGYCNRYWHVENRCRVKKRDEESRQKRNGDGRSEQHDHQAKRAKLDVKEEGPSQDLSFISISCWSARNSSEWYADSGATQHMCDQKWMLENFVAITPGSWEVNGIGDSKVQALGYGDVPIYVQKDDKTKPGIIKNVLYVPGLGVNLLSIGSVADHGHAVVFKDSEVTVNLGNDVQMTGSRVGKSLYRLNISPRAPPTQKMTLAAASTVSNAPLVLWHKRLAHVNYKSIIRMVGKNAVRGIQLAEGSKPSDELCSGCALGKMSRLPFEEKLRSAVGMQNIPKA